MYMYMYLMIVVWFQYCGNGSQWNKQHEVFI
jgi:hypothetical protein